MIRISEKIAVSFPCPNKLFLDNQNRNNYNMIVHKRNLESADKLFPL